MYKNILFKGALLITVVLLSACDKWLYLEPQDGIVKQEFWKTKEQVQSAVIGCYSSLLGNPVGAGKTLTESLFLWGELRGDMLAPGPGIRDEQEVLNGNILPVNTISDWRAIYRTINYCNTVIEYAPQVLESDKTFKESQLNAYLAEALTLRALMYFYLARTFGEVPLVIEATVSDEQNLAIPKSTQPVILKQILADLEIAEKSAVTTYGNRDFDKGRITRFTVNALQADVYLWMEQYTQCIEACDKLINSGQFGLVSSNSWSEWYATLYARGNSNESIFEFQFDAQKLNPFIGMFATSRRRFQVPSRVIEEIFMTDLEGLDPDYRGSGASYLSDGTVFKYLRSETGSMRTDDQSFAHWIVYRYADILLLKAEAMSQIGRGVEALEIVQLIRARAYAPTASAREVDPNDKNEVAEYIMEERSREFAYEGKRWFDILRNAKRNRYAQINVLLNIVAKSATPERQQSIINKYRDTLSHYLPISIIELQVNPNLKQNPFYNQ